MILVYRRFKYDSSFILCNKFNFDRHKSVKQIETNFVSILSFDQLQEIKFRSNRRLLISFHARHFYTVRQLTVRHKQRTKYWEASVSIQLLNQTSRPFSPKTQRPIRQSHKRCLGLHFIGGENDIFGIIWHLSLARIVFQGLIICSRHLGGRSRCLGSIYKTNFMVYHIRIEIVCSN